LKQRHTVHGISRAALWVFTFSLNLALSHFHIPTRYNCVYTGRDIVESLTYLSLEAEYAEGGLDALRKRLRRRGRPGKVPSSDTFLYRLKKLARRDALGMLQEMNTEVLARAKVKGAFRRKAVAAVDLTFIPYYGWFSRHVVQGRYKLGTNQFHCYAAFRLVEMGRRYVVKSRLVTQLELSEKPRIVEELVAEARRRGVRIRLLLLDKGFYSGDVIKKLKSMGVKFLIAVPRNSRVKKEIMDYYRSGEGQVRRFALEKDMDRVDFNLTVHRLRRSKKGLRNILELYGAFATNLSPGKALEAWRRIPEEYRRRWGVETGFRVGKGFRAKTTSTDEEVREIYHQYAVVLENLWTLHNMGEAKRRGLPLDGMRRPLVKVKEFSLDFSHFLLSAYGPGPPWG
jgi:hypothetical protein